MLTAYIVVMTLCSGVEGCLDSAKSKPYSSRSECQQAVDNYPARRGVKYTCREAPQLVHGGGGQQEKAPRLMTTSAATP